MRTPLEVARAFHDGRWRGCCSGDCEFVRSLAKAIEDRDREVWRETMLQTAADVAGLRLSPDRLAKLLRHKACTAFANQNSSSPQPNDGRR